MKYVFIGYDKTNISSQSICCIDIPKKIWLYEIRNGIIVVFVYLFYRIFDKDDDGLISVEELRHIMLSFGEKMTEKELDEMIAEANCDKDGHIDYEGEINVIHIIKVFSR